MVKLLLAMRIQSSVHNIHLMHNKGKVCVRRSGGMWGMDGWDEAEKVGRGEEEGRKRKSIRRRRYDKEAC